MRPIKEINTPKIYKGKIHIIFYVFEIVWAGKIKSGAVLAECSPTSYIVYIQIQFLPLRNCHIKVVIKYQ